MNLEKAYDSIDGHGTCQIHVFVPDQQFNMVCARSTWYVPDQQFDMVCASCYGCIELSLREIFLKAVHIVYFQSGEGQSGCE